MTDTLHETERDALRSSGSPERGRTRAWLLRLAVAVACATLGFLLVAQVRATEGLGERLAAEREEDLARILADLTDESDKLQNEITELRLLLFDFESSAERDELARASLQRRLDDLQILAGTVEAEGPGVVFTIADPASQVAQSDLVDTIQELRAGGAEAMAINGVRLVAQSAVVTRNNRIVVDGKPLSPPYRISAIGVPDTLTSALTIAGGSVDTLDARSGVTTNIEQFAQLSVPARNEPVPFVFGEPVPLDDQRG